MDFATNQAVKVLRDGRSWHGGYHAWSLPTQRADGTWEPGAWTPPVTPHLCSTGYHLTRDPAQWWGSDAGVVGYLAEWDGVAVEREDKVAVERCRLLRPLTREEQASCGIFTGGAHTVTSGRAWASGSATVQASGSATVQAWDSATVQAWDSVTVRAWNSATVRAWNSATVRAWDSVTVQAWGSARAHASGQATATAWSGATVVLTRSEQGVLIDRRSGGPKVYAKRAGIDGWRYRDGEWVRVKVRPKHGSR